MPGGYWYAPGLLPRFWAQGALSITLLSGDGDEWSCRRIGDSTEWALPGDLNGPGTYTFRVEWQSMDPKGGPSHTSKGRLVLLERVIDDDYRPLGQLTPFVESGDRRDHYLGEFMVPAGSEVPFGILTADGGESDDLLEMDVTARYLGPGIGEMSRRPEAGFDWLVIGPKNKPDLLVFIGKPTAPALPGPRRSPDAGDRRIWRLGFKARNKYFRSAGCDYLDWALAPPSLQATLQEMTGREGRNSQIEPCPVTRLETYRADAPTLVPLDPKTQEVVDAIAARSVTRAGLTYLEVKDIIATLTGQKNPVFLQQVLRGWCESGMVDLLRDPRTSHLTLMARRPRLVLYRQGPLVEATLVGLTTSVRRTRVMAFADGLNLRHSDLGGNHAWQPGTLRFTGTLAQMEALSQGAELQSHQWLAWPDRCRAPQCLSIARIMEDLQGEPPPAAYQQESHWDWDRSQFSRNLATGGGGVQIQRRAHQDKERIYVVLRDGEPHLWTYNRTWALLAGFSLRETPPFTMDQDGSLVSQGLCPVHLPLPLGRLCTIIGNGLPGARFSPGSPEQNQYVYPFGTRLSGLLGTVMPPEWYCVR